MALSGDTAVRSGMNEDVALAAAGDASAFERVYRTHVAKIHSLTRRMLGSHEADEVTQDIFVRTWQKLGQFRGDSAFSTWLHRLAVNTALMELRSRAGGEERETDDAALEFVGTVDTAGQRLREQMDLERAVATLPERARAVLVLHDIEGWKHEEIASELGMAVGSSKAQLHRARNLLRQRLGDEHERD